MPVALAKRTYTMTRSAGTIGLTSSVALTGLGQTGNIVKFSLRQDATNDRGSAGILYIADAPLDSVAAIPSKDLIYQSATISGLTGSATAVAAAGAEADLAVAALPKGEPYILNDVNTPLNAVFRVTAVPGSGASATTMYLTIWAEVRS